MKSIALLLLTASTCLMAAPEGEDPPAPPFLKDLPAQASVTRAFSSGNPDGADKSSGLFIEERSLTEKSGDVRRVTVTFLGREKPQILWVKGGIGMGVHPLDPARELTTGLPIDPTSCDLASDFPDAAWVALRNFRGMAVLGEKKCRLHEDDLPVRMVAMGDESVANYNFPFGKVRAWIDEETRWPVQIQIGNRITKFTYGPPPGALAFPDPYLRQLKFMELGRQGRLR